MTLTLTGIRNGANETLSFNTAAQTAATAAGLTGVNSYTYNSSTNTGTLSITGSASSSAYQTVLQGLQFNDAVAVPAQFDRIVNVVVNDGSLPSVSNSITIGVEDVWGEYNYPAQPTPNVHLFNPTVQVNTAKGILAVSYLSTIDFNANNPAGPYNTVETVLPLDPFFLASTSGKFDIATFTQATEPQRSAVILPNILTANGINAEGLAFLSDTTSLSNGAIDRILITGSNTGPVVTPDPGPLEVIGSDTIFNIKASFRQGDAPNNFTNPSPTPATPYLNNYSLAWDQYDASAHTFKVKFQIFDSSGNPTSGSSPVDALSLSSIASSTALPAWGFQGQGGLYVAAFATPDSSTPAGFNLTGVHDAIQFQGYFTDGTANVSTNPEFDSTKTTSFLIQPNLSAYAVGATNHITQQIVPTLVSFAGGAASMLAFGQYSAAFSNRYAIAWNEAVTDSSGNFLGDQVEFVVTGSGLTSPRRTFQIADGNPQNVRVVMINNNADAVLAYGDNTATHIVEYAIVNNTLTQIASITDPTTHAYTQLFSLGDGRVAISYDNTLDISQTSQFDFKVFDLRTAALSGTGVGDFSSYNDGQTKYIAGTHFTGDTVFGENNVNNFYYFVGQNINGNGPTDSFTGGLNGWNAAVFPDARSNYSITTNGSTISVANTTGDAAHRGTLNVTGVQALSFGSTNEPAPNADGSIEAKDGTLVLLDPAYFQSYRTLDDPAAGSGGSTYVDGINDLGQLSGWYYNGAYVGLLYNGSYFHLSDPFGSNGTAADGLNSSGVVVGEYYDGSFNVHGFSHTGTDYTTGYVTIDDPAAGPKGTVARAVNASGEIVGTYYDTNLVLHGFVDNNSAFTNFDDPFATQSQLSAGHGIDVLGVNDAGNIVGYYYDSSGFSHGFLHSGTDYTAGFITVDDPLADPAHGGTAVSGINNVGEIVGYYFDSAGHAHGFIHTGTDYSSGYQTIDDPSADPAHFGTIAKGINDLGQVAGYFGDASGIAHGFLSPPPVKIADGATLELYGSTTPGSIVFEGSHGTLQIDHASILPSMIIGFTGNGSLSGSDIIDIRDVDYTSPNFSHPYNNTQQILSLTDGTHTASLKFATTSGNFQFMSDGNGGTLIWDPPGPADSSSSSATMPSTSTDDIVQSIDSDFRQLFDTVQNLGTSFNAKLGDAISLLSSGQGPLSQLTDPQLLDGLSGDAKSKLMDAEHTLATDIARLLDHGMNADGTNPDEAHNLLALQGIFKNQLAQHAADFHLATLLLIGGLSALVAGDPQRAQAATLVAEQLADVLGVDPGRFDALFVSGSDTPALVPAGGSLDLSGGESKAVQFQSSTGTLAVEHAADFHATVSGFSGDGTLAGSDQIDLKDLNFSALAPATYADHVLSLSDGTHTAQIRFAGDYQLENFKFADDGSPQHGTIVYDPPVAAQAALPNADASQPSVTDVSASPANTATADFKADVTQALDAFKASVSDILKGDKPHTNTDAASPSDKGGADDHAVMANNAAKPPLSLLSDDQLSHFSASSSKAHGDSFLFSDNLAHDNLATKPHFEPLPVDNSLFDGLQHLLEGAHGFNGQSVVLADGSTLALTDTMKTVLQQHQGEFHFA
jgi:hypothetical protein